MAKTFFPITDNATRGKAKGALDKSKNNRNALILHFGGQHLLPSSIMTVKRARVTAKEDGPGAARTYTATSPMKDKKVAKDLKGSFSISGRGAGSGALSTFWQDVGRSCVLLYSEPGQVVVDPFAGHNSRMDLCVKAGRHYIGHDLSHEFMEFNRKRAAELRKEFPGIKIELHEGDSRKLKAASNSGDFTITSPPYWDIEYYGPEGEQMSNCKTYVEFIAEMQLVMTENFRVLKPGAYAAWFINDFRKDGVFYNYHGDIIRIGRRAGFVQHDLMVVDLGRAFGDVFINQYVEKKMLPKRHEFAVILRKPLE